MLTEGVIRYLSEAEAGSLADDLRAMANLNYWVVDSTAPKAMKYRGRAGLNKKLKNAPFKFMPSDWFAFFAGHGWTPKDMRYFSEEALRLKRPIPLRLFYRIVIRLSWRFAPKEKRERAMRFAGYALLQPTRG